jgi:hypothetical protein
MSMPQATTIQGTLNQLRLYHGAMLCSILLYPVVLSVMPVSQPQSIGMPILAALGVTSVAISASGFYFRGKYIDPSMEMLRLKPDDLKALGQWKIGAVISAALAEAIALFGVVIYLLSGIWRHAAPFLIAGFIIMAIWWPRRP